MTILQENSVMNFCSQLPDEILIIVFKNLSSKDLATCSSVCRQWRRISCDGDFWRCVHLKQERISLFSLANLIQRGVETLELRLSKITDQRCLDGVFPDNYENKLQNLDLSWSNVSENGLFTILKHCQHLVKLSLSKCYLNEEICEAISKNPYLEVIELFGCEGINATGLEAILNNCERIKMLNLAYTELSVETLDVLTSRLRPNVDSLDFLSYGRDTLLDRHILEIVKACPKLNYLNIKFNTALTQVSDNAVLNLPCLQKYYR